MIPTTSPFDSPPWPLWKTDGSWRMTGAHWELQPGGDSNCSCCSRRELEQMNSSLVPAMQLLIWQMPVSPLLPIRPAKRSGFQRVRLAMYPDCPTTWYIDSPALCPNLVRKDLHHLPFHGLSHWSIVLMILCRLDLASQQQQPLQTYWKDICVKGGKTHLTKIQGPSTSVISGDLVVGCNVKISCLR